MKLKYTLTVILTALFLAGYAQVSEIDPIQIENPQCKFSNRAVSVQFTLKMDVSDFSSKEQMIFTPVIQAADGQKTTLPPLILNGKTRDKLYKRSLSLNGVKNVQVFDARVVNKKEQALSIPYQASVPYQPWMRQAAVSLVGDLCGCARDGHGTTQWLLASTLSMTPFDDLLNQYTFVPNFVIPVKESHKERWESGEAYLIFEQGKWDILPRLKNNRTELAKISRSLDYVKSESTAIITGISIKAYASPEGDFDKNKILSEERARELVEYIRANYGFPANVHVFSEGYGEDWEGLERMVREDTKMEYRSQVLDIIKNVSIFNGRKEQIRELGGGSVYRYMLNKFYPYLRHDDYKIDYTVPAFSQNKIRELFETKPNMLSLEEIYSLSNAYEKGSPAFNQVIEKAANVYPQDKIANINAASVAILEGNYTKAKQLLFRYKDSPEAWNNLGIVYIGEAQLQEAETYLQKAQKAGFSEAAQNLQYLNEIKADYQSNQQ